jgi:prepilin-type processing-associated H-X9-DG protein
VVRCGRWQVISAGDGTSLNDYLTMRHDGRATVTMTDGHAEAVPWQFGTDINNLRFDQ